MTAEKLTQILGALRLSESLLPPAGEKPKRYGPPKIGDGHDSQKSREPE